MHEWPEGPAADPEAARERYDADMDAARKGIRGVLRAEPSEAHLGLAIVILAGVVVGFFAGAVAGGMVAGGFVLLFASSLAVLRWRGVHGRDALRRAYLLAFGWGKWI